MPDFKKLSSIYCEIMSQIKQAPVETEQFVHKSISEM